MNLVERVLKRLEENQFASRPGAPGGKRSKMLSKEQDKLIKKAVSRNPHAEGGAHTDPEKKGVESTQAAKRRGRRR
jgi:hypothetical protein